MTADELGTGVGLAVGLSVLLGARAPARGDGGEQTFYVLDEDVTLDTGLSLFRQFNASVALRNYPWDTI